MYAPISTPVITSAFVKVLWSAVLSWRSGCGRAGASAARTSGAAPRPAGPRARRRRRSAAPTGRPTSGASRSARPGRWRSARTRSWSPGTGRSARARPAPGPSLEHPEALQGLAAGHLGDDQDPAQGHGEAGHGSALLPVAGEALAV